MSWNKRRKFSWWRRTRRRIAHFENFELRAKWRRVSVRDHRFLSSGGYSDHFRAWVLGSWSKPILPAPTESLPEEVAVLNWGEVQEVVKMTLAPTTKPTTKPTTTQATKPKIQLVTQPRPTTKLTTKPTEKPTAPPPGQTTTTTTTKAITTTKATTTTKLTTASTRAPRLGWIDNIIGILRGQGCVGGNY